MQLPKTHIYLIIVLAVTFTLFYVNQYNESPKKSDESLNTKLDSIAAKTQKVSENDVKRIEHTIAAGESLASIFKKYGYESRISIF